MLTFFLQIYTVIRKHSDHASKDPHDAVQDNVVIVTSIPIGKESRRSSCQKAQKSQLAAKLPPDCNARPGEHIRLFADMSRIKLFDADTGENILYI